ncbi:hypothetical protein [Streptomyces sp. NPDC056056]|uniref:hypothetical protein n=1 Tax=Streptomyces sp. NPDC056056 TaxID=3345698 RepID=UPI0035D79C9C
MGWLTDSIGGMPSRTIRLRAADWALRVTRQDRVRALEPSGRVLALGLMALAPQVAHDMFVSSAWVSHIFGVDFETVAHELDRLVEIGFLSDWSVDPILEDLTWNLASVD